MRRYYVQRFLMLLCVFASVMCGISSAQSVADSAERKTIADQPVPPDRERLDFDKNIAERRLTFDKDIAERRFTFDKKKYDTDRRMENWKFFGTLGGLLIPLLIAAFTYRAQIKARHRDEALQFELKAAEIVMSARDVNEAANKAELLTLLFPERLPRLQDVLNKPNVPYFGRSNERREELLKLLAANPANRRDIIRAWEILFPWDSPDVPWQHIKKDYKWFGALKHDSIVGQNAAAPSSCSGGA
jgi:hypothetical protein